MDAVKTQYSISVCGGPDKADKKDELVALLKSELGKAGLSEKVGVNDAGTIGFLEDEPVLMLHQGHVVYKASSDKDVAEIVSAIKDGKKAERLVLKNDRIANGFFPLSWRC